MNVEEIELWFRELCRQTEEPCKIYIFAGAALALKRLKPVTKDIDLIFENEEERSVFEKALEARGYQRSWKGHGASDHTGWSLKTGGETQLYCPGPHPFKITPTMKRRSTPYGSIGRAEIFVLRLEDLLLLKTYIRTNNHRDEAKFMRQSDISDVEALLTTSLDWTVIQKEIDAQVRNIIKDPGILDKRCAHRIVNRFHLALTSLKNKFNIPDDVIVWAKRRSRELNRRRGHD